ncbi:MAG: replication initiation protein [Cetobacterium sp.]
MMKKLGFIKRNELVSLKGNTLSIRARKMLDYICKIGLDMYEKEHDEDGIYPITIKELKEMAEMNLKSDHSELLEELKAINKLEFETWDDKYYTQFPILAGFKVDNTKGIVEFALSPFLLRETFKKKDSNPYYHYCDLMEYKGLRSKYSKILLDLYTRYKHVSIPKLSIEKFKDMMQYPDKYKTNDIKRFVLEQAQKELLAKNNLQLDWVVEKYGRQWGCITLTIKNLNPNKKIEEHKAVVVPKSILELLDRVRKHNRFIAEHLTPENIETLYKEFGTDLAKGLTTAMNSIKNPIAHFNFLRKKIKDILAISEPKEKSEEKQSVEVTKNVIPARKNKVNPIDDILENLESKNINHVEDVNQKIYDDYLKMSIEKQNRILDTVKEEYKERAGCWNRGVEIGFNNSKRKLIIDYIKENELKVDKIDIVDKVEKKVSKEVLSEVDKALKMFEIMQKLKVRHNFPENILVDMKYEALEILLDRLENVRKETFKGMKK